MQGARLDYLNMALMVVAGVAALCVPFELFLLSYAVLGPLHYLTEIGWLHDKRYFLPGKRSHWLLVGMCVLAAGLQLLLSLAGPKLGVGSQDASNWFPGVQTLAVAIPACAFLSSLALIRLANSPWRWPALAAVAAFCAWAAAWGGGYWFYLTSAVLLPTLCHVFVFTAAFVLYGALKSRSATGLWSLAVFAGCTVFLFAWQPAGAARRLHPAVIERYEASFLFLNRELLSALWQREVTWQEIFYSPASIVLTRFIAFAYTYHYLNWFSKTSVIRWHEVPKARLVGTACLWLLAVGLYLLDFQLVLVVLGTLGLLHIFLEFPLNWQCLLGIGAELSAIRRRGWRRNGAERARPTGSKPAGKPNGRAGVRLASSGC